MAETYYSFTELIKLTDNLIAAVPTSFYNGVMAVRGGLATLPTADVVARDCYDRLLAENDELRKERPVRHGRWIDTDNYFQRWKCSVCGSHTRDARPPFCPNCGARMDMVTDSNQVKDGDGDV